MLATHSLRQRVVHAYLLNEEIETGDMEDMYRPKQLVQGGATTQENLRPGKVHVPHPMCLFPPATHQSVGSAKLLSVFQDTFSVSCDGSHCPPLKEISAQIRDGSLGDIRSCF